MAQTLNPFAPRERSKIETPWGVFEVAAPNKQRMEQLQALDAADAEIPDSDVMAKIANAIKIAGAGVVNGDKLVTELEAAWEAGEVTALQIRQMVEFIGAEISGEAEAGND